MDLNDKIDLYLKGSLPEQERYSFEVDISDNPELEDKIWQRELALEAVSLLIEDDIRTKLYAESFTLGRRKFIKRIRRIAAGIIILVFSASLLYSSLNYSDSRLALYGYAGTGPIDLSQAGSSREDLFAAGTAAYFDEKNYDKAKELFLAIQPQDALSLYYLAHSSFNNKDFAEAAAIFEQMIEQREYPPFTDAKNLQWHLLMSRLGNGEDIRQDLENVLKEPEYQLFHDKAGALLKELGGFWRKIAIK